MFTWPSFYYPTTAVFVDDNKSFLTALKNRLPDNLPTKLFTNPLLALDDIKSQENYNLKNQNNIRFFENDFNETDNFQLNNSNQLLVELRYDIFTKALYEIQRFSTQSIVIVDQLMPELDGISFCEELKDIPIKKIMLTANSDYAIAIEAFNNGIIDYYLSKDSPDLLPQLIQKIQVLQKKFFESEIECSMGCLLNLTAQINDLSSLPFYEQVKKDLRATEYYLLDRWGSMLFITSEGIPTTLVISTSDTLDVFSKIADDQDQLSTALLLSSRDHLLFFPSQADHMRPASEWSAFLHPAKPFPGKKDVYYSLISNLKSQPVDIKRIKPQIPL